MKKEMEEIIRENYGDIYKYCFRHLNRKGEAEDMTQEIFLRFLTHREQYREYGKIKNYLYVIAGNAVKDYWKKHREQPGRAEEEDEKSGDMDEVLERVRVRAALDALEEQEREMIILRYYQELRIRDIGRIMDMPPSTVRLRLKKAESKLREQLA